MKKTSLPPIFKPLKMFTMKELATRPKCLDILKTPSRMGSKLHYPKEIGLFDFIADAETAIKNFRELNHG